MYKERSHLIADLKGDGAATVCAPGARTRGISRVGRFVDPRSISSESSLCDSEHQS